jgi:hypothetical protein
MMSVPLVAVDLITEAVLERIEAGTVSLLGCPGKAFVCLPGETESEEPLIDTGDERLQSCFEQRRVDRHLQGMKGVLHDGIRVYVWISRRRYKMREMQPYRSRKSCV